MITLPDRFYSAISSIFLALLVFFFAILFSSCRKYELGIVVDRGALAKSSFYNGAFTRTIMRIQYSEINSMPGKKIVIIGQKECHIIDPQTRKLKKVFKFKRSVGEPELLMVNDEGHAVIMLKGGGFDAVGLMTDDGDYIWRREMSAGTGPKMASGDLDRDGIMEFYVVDYDGLYRFDYSGNEFWKVNESRLDDIQIYDPGTNAQPLTVANGFNSKKRNPLIQYRDSSGRLVKEVIPKDVIFGLEFVKWPDEYNILTETSSQITIMDLDGNIIFKHKMKKDFWGYMDVIGHQGVSVKFKANERPYLAVLTKYRQASKRSMLSVFSPKGELIYQELLISSDGISAIENSDNSESLLVGEGREKVWIYNASQGK